MAAVRGHPRGRQFKDFLVFPFALSVMAVLVTAIHVEV
jgi:hypothetical protein